MTPEQFLISLNNLPHRDFMKDRRRLPEYLARMQFFLHLLGNPEKKIPHAIHVTGTSGKGSVSSFLASILKTAGQKTGLMLSPHPEYMRERWQINGRPMSERELYSIMRTVKPALDAYIRTSPHDRLSHFDVLTAIGFLYFAEQKADWMVIEVGCGGRFDSTNVLPKKNAAVITNVGLDHTELLGNTKEKIAYEKAGIISPDSRVYTMEKIPRVLAVIEKECRKQSATLTSAEEKSSDITQTADRTSFSYRTHRYHLRTIGRHQVANAILAIRIASDLGIPDRAIEQGLARAHQPLRMEIVSKNPCIILDGAHNADKMRTTVRTINEWQKREGNIRIHLILGFSGNKQWKAMIRQLSTLKPAAIACTRNSVDPFRKVANPREFAEYAQTLLPKTNIAIFLDPRDALQWSRKRQKKNDILLATGSIFLSGELRSILTKMNKNDKGFNI